MIKINNNTHEKNLSKTVFGQYEVTQDGKKEKGKLLLYHLILITNILV